MRGRLTPALLGAVNQTIHLLMTPESGAQPQPPAPQTSVLNRLSRDRPGKQTKTQVMRIDGCSRERGPACVESLPQPCPEGPSPCPAPLAAAEEAGGLNSGARSRLHLWWAISLPVLLARLLHHLSNGKISCFEQKTTFCICKRSANWKKKKK